jgi:flagellar motor switch protein FliG
MDYSQLTGPVKAAILIRSLGKKAAERMLNSLTDDERQVVYRQLDQIGTVSAEITEHVAKEFADIATGRALKGPLALPSGSGHSPKSGENNGSPPDGAEGLEAIASLSAEEISDLIKDEHPQTIAIILLHLKIPVASDVMANLPDDIKTDVSVRVVTLEKVNADIVDEVNEVFKEILKNKKSSVANISGGVARLAEILNQTEKQTQRWLPRSNRRCLCLKIWCWLMTGAFRNCFAKSKQWNLQQRLKPRPMKSKTRCIEICRSVPVPCCRKRLKISVLFG